MGVFDRAYEGTPSWEIGRAQSAVVRLGDAGLVIGRVLDVGCGSGENALYLAARGHAVVGIDVAAAAVERARRKATDRGLTVEFRIADALEPGALGEAFDTIVDSGLFHTLQPFQRAPYAASLRRSIADGGRCFVLCWSERNQFGYGPERVTRRALRTAFSVGWHVDSILPETLETRLGDGTAHAWLARLRPIPPRGRAARVSPDREPSASPEPPREGSSGGGARV